ncbi:DUF6636 domain-containing protein [Labrys sp. La1]|uniref:DUF6636 domain-containing protein n=1 Tax=Labrys sp. La1 TaxID=3404917 RepID=UPI003EBF83DC
MKKPRFILPVTLALSLMPTTLSVPALADDSMVSFAMPSGNISCRFIPQSEGEGASAGLELPTLSCEREKQSPARIILGPSGKGAIYKDISDPFCCDGDTTVGYGQTWENGPFKCVSAEDGLTCRRRDGHGFFISRAKLLAY